MQKGLSIREKKKLIPFLIKRDGTFECFFCKKSLTIETWVPDHLNSNPFDNRPENFVFSCQPCNVKKSKSVKLQILAKAKLEDNELRPVQTINLLEDTSYHYSSTEIEINQTNYEITKQHLLERIVTDGSIEYSKAINICSYLCKQKTGHGSQQSVRNYIDMLTSEVGPFMVARDENKKKIIVKRCN